MKRRIVVVNFIASFAVLCAMLFQTVHSYEHFFRQLSEKPCQHHSSANQKQITHSHSTDTNCHVCHFSFSTFIPNAFQAVIFQKTYVETKLVFTYTKSVSTLFKGSLFALRAPPALF
ncbi:hypothetical protein ASE40_16790 [Flavobacterium sp. Root935]|uniref:hypothetical protein n=1 Tax=Flavobacterium sp. Root935 TaxID=1736610 RepID=UPI00070BACC3|nr:hypothetical protein [Flavobacterium sp. Root935]KRD57999.1 hypothetical protein ASE40_16790 [Flavobacterium sp. Root935]